MSHPNEALVSTVVVKINEVTGCSLYDGFGPLKKRLVTLPLNYVI